MCAHSNTHQSMSDCVIAFRGHQDQCFGLKLLFDEATFEDLPDKQRRALYTGNGMYEEGPFWWRQVLELVTSRSSDIGEVDSEMFAHICGGSLPLPPCLMSMPTSLSGESGSVAA